MHHSFGDNNETSSESKESNNTTYNPIKQTQASSLEFKNLIVDCMHDAFNYLLCSKASAYHELKYYDGYIVTLDNSFKLQPNTMYQILDISKIAFSSSPGVVIDELPRLDLNHKPILFWIHSENEEFIQQSSNIICKAAGYAHYEQDKYSICSSNTFYSGMEWFLRQLVDGK